MRARGFLVLLLVLVGCQAEQTQWEARYDAILLETDSAAAGVPLPRVPGALPADSVTGPRGLARFLLAGDELVLDASHTRPRAFPTPTSGVAPDDVLPAAPRTVGTLGPPVALEPSMLDLAVVDGAELLVDRALDARTVLRAIDAIARTYRLTHAVLRVDSDGHGGSIQLALGSYVRHGDRADTSSHLDLEAYVLPSGVELSGAGGTIAPECRVVGPPGTLTLPDQGGDVDREGLTTCLERILAQFPDETQIYVAAAEGVSVERLAAVMVALHGEPPRGLHELLPLAGRFDRSPAPSDVDLMPSPDPSVFHEILRGVLEAPAVTHEDVLAPAS